MPAIRSYIRYQSWPRRHLYKFLKVCDKLGLYNQLYRKWILSKTAKVSRFPADLSIETTNQCNARCIICAHPDMKRLRSKMDADLVYNLIDQAAKHKVEKLFLSGFGEPLLDRRMAEFVAHAKDKGLTNISIVTNGSLLTSPVAAELTDAGLNEIIISVDGFDEKTFDKIRIGLNFDRLFENIRRLPGLKNRSRVRIIISCVDLGYDRRQKRSAFQTFGGYVDCMYWRQPQGWTKDYAKSFAGYSPHYETNCIPCRYLWHSMSVCVDGRVPTCCLDYEAEAVMGDANVDSIEDIWKGEKYSFYRRAHIRKGKSQIRPCSECGYYSVWW